MLSIAVDPVNHIYIRCPSQRTRGGDILQSSARSTGEVFSECSAIRGTDGQTVHDDTFYNEHSPERKGNSTLANPLFNLIDWRGDLLMMERRWQFGVLPASNAIFAWVQNKIHPLELMRLSSVGLANRSMLSRKSGEGVNIRSSREVVYA